MPATVGEFAAVSDAAAATTKRLAKQASLAAYFRTLADDADLRRAVRYAAGRVFPSTAERVLNVGGAVFGDAARDLLEVDPDVLHDAVVRRGEVGEALDALWPARFAEATAGDTPAASRLTLGDLDAAFEELAATGNRERKREILYALLTRCRTGREAAYVAKTIFREPRTGVQEGVLQGAVAEAFGRPVADVRRAQLFVGDLDEVAVLARHDRLGGAEFRLFHPIQFMLATPQETAAAAAGTMAGRPFYAEDKLDGIRAQVHKQGDGPAARVAIYTRTMDRADESFPDVVSAVRALPGDFLLDGEIVPFRDGTVLPFAHIQKRLGRKTLTASILADNPAVFVAFDALYRDGRVLMDAPLRQRRDELHALAHRLRDAGGARGVDATIVTADDPGRPALLCTDAAEVENPDEIDAAFFKSREARNEGLVLKDPDSVYSPGRRGRAWLKLKTHLPTLDCVVTAAETGHGKRRNSLSDYTFAVWDRDPATDGATLVNVGKAFSGVTDEETAQLTELFTTLTIQQWGRVRQVRPQVVLEIACDQIQRSKRHASGYALRFPRIKRVRWDKRLEDADRLTRVAELYASAENTAGGGDDPAAVGEPTLFDGL